MSWWVGGSFRGFQCCTTYCCTAVVLLYCCCTGLWVGRSVLSCRVLLSCVHTGSWVCLFIFLPLYRPRAGIVKRAASDYYSGVLILSFTEKTIVRACSMFYQTILYELGISNHSTCKVEFQPLKRLYSQLTLFNF